jgi:LPXTG-site transpeptidase (sortase) family protein
LAGLGLALHPYLPQAYFELVPQQDRQIPYYVSRPEALGVEVEPRVARAVEEARRQVGPQQAPVAAAAIPQENRLVIPKIGVDSRILEGSSLAVLGQDEGVWREPESADPTTGGNMVIAGHRFTYASPNWATFYNLNQLQAGDRFVVFWNQQEFLYEVKETRIVSPYDVAVRDDTEGKTEITLYSCDPIGSVRDRLVVKAELLPASSAAADAEHKQAAAD